MSLTRLLSSFKWRDHLTSSRFLFRPRPRIMDFQTSVSKLKSPLKDLVLAFSKNGTVHVGKQEADSRAVIDWIAQIEKGTSVNEPGLKALNAELVPKTYLVNNYLTAADVALFGALHPVISTSQPDQYFAHPSVTRYFDHIQSLTVVREAADAFSPAFAAVAFDFTKAPVVERTAEAPKKKEKKAPAAAQEPAASTSAAPPAVSGASGAETAAPAKEKKEKKEKEKKKDAGPDAGGKKKGAAPSKAVAAEEAGEPVPSMIDLRVGHIVDIMKHPDADGLYVEQIDIGEETGPRTVVSGLVNYIPIEQMRDKYLVAVCNLKPASMRGVKSFAMVLCATSKDGKEGGIELIQPPAGAKPGDRVYFEGAEFEAATPLSQLNPKKKIFETIQPGFITLDSKEAAWINPATKSVHKIRTKDGVCVAPTLIGASLS
ncbi:unnamed protein product [Mycena citricolor]|uniref:tRNA-binding domain-containing protein n=1 Tax=Mycena citricolor TaxID=2018698 RepID=A0AAD2Q3K5_9AGAR|nr:unnamed protein product [Mycena citricolor]